MSLERKRSLDRLSGMSSGLGLGLGGQPSSGSGSSFGLETKRPLGSLGGQPFRSPAAASILEDLSALSVSRPAASNSNRVSLGSLGRPAEPALPAARLPSAAAQQAAMDIRKSLASLDVVDKAPAPAEKPAPTPEAKRRKPKKPSTPKSAGISESPSAPKPFAAADADKSAATAAAAAKVEQKPARQLPKTTPDLDVDLNSADFPGSSASDAWSQQRAKVAGGAGAAGAGAERGQAGGTLRKLLQQFTCDKIMSGFSSQFLALHKTHDTGHAIKFFNKVAVSACPIVDASTKSVTSLVDMRDVVYNVFNRVSNAVYTKIRFESKAKPLTEAEVESVKAAGPDLKGEELQNVAGCSGVNPCVSLEAKLPADEVLSAFATGLLHSPVLDERKTFIGLISDADIVRLLNDNAAQPELKVLHSTTVGKLQEKYTSEFDSVPSSKKVLAAIEMMCLHRMHPLAVTDAKGTLLVTLDAFMLKKLFAERDVPLLCTIEAYVRLLGPKAEPARWVTAQNSAAELLQEFSRTKSRVVWVVNNDRERKPIGCISSSDLLDFVRSVM